MHIDSYNFGRITIDKKEFYKDVIIFSDYVFSPWLRKEGHFLSAEDLSNVFDKKPKILIIGTGYSGLMEVPDKVMKILKEKNIEFFILKTKEACNKFNELTSANKNPIAVLHLTC